MLLIHKHCSPVTLLLNVFFLFIYILFIYIYTAPLLYGCLKFESQLKGTYPYRSSNSLPVSSNLSYHNERRKCPIKIKISLKSNWQQKIDQLHNFVSQFVHLEGFVNIIYCNVCCQNTTENFKIAIIMASVDSQTYCLKTLNLSYSDLSGPSVILPPWKTTFSLETEAGNQRGKWHMVMNIEEETGNGKRGQPPEWTDRHDIDYNQNMKCAWWLSQGSTSECTTWKGWGCEQCLSPGGKGMGDVML